MTDREKLTELVKDVLDYLPWGQISSHTAKEIADHLIENGATFATDNNVGHWIPVTERLPNDRGDVLVCAWWHEKWQALTGWYAITSDMWHILTADGFLPWDHVTHWMPLPEPPMEVEG